MNNEITWSVELQIKPGQLESFKELTRQMVETTKAEPGLLIYERFIDEKNLIVFVYERYTDSVAAETHLIKFRKEYGEKFSSMVVRKSFNVLGTPGNDLKEIQDEFGATYYDHLDGFSQAFPKSLIEY
jgi:quinol monooxygenase YgiN